MANNDLPDDVVDGIERLVRDRWHEEKIDFTRSLGDRNHVFRTLARLNDFFDLGLSVGKPAREMLENGPFDDRGELEARHPADRTTTIS